MEQMRAVVKIEPYGEGVFLVYFEAGEITEFRPTDLVPLGPVFAPLSEPDFASSIRIIHDGIAITWPKGIEISAETVFRNSKAHSAQTEVSRPRVS